MTSDQLREQAAQQALVPTALSKDAAAGGRHRWWMLAGVRARGRLYLKRRSTTPSR